ncbi:MAG: hypothetical protein H7839_09200 [Magnetococcus sp. YQC-5]
MSNHKGQLPDKEQLRIEIRMNLEEVVRDIDCFFDGVTERIGAMAGVGVGGTSSLGIMALLGESITLAGIKVGFGVAGSLVGGTLAAAAMIVCVPVAIGGLSGYFLVRKRKQETRRFIVEKSLDALYKMFDQTSVDDLFFKKERELITEFISILREEI